MKRPKNREEWLSRFTEAARPQFESAGAPLPANIRMAVGYTSKGAKGKSIGECWSSSCSKDGTFEIFISPKLDDSRRVAGVLVHELTHAAVGIDKGHGKAFGKVARAIGLEGKMRATTEGERFYAWADPIIQKLGVIPHAALEGGMTSGPKKQSTRMLKCECTSCGFTFRAAQKWAAIATICPDENCGGMVVCDLPEEPADE